MKSYEYYKFQCWYSLEFVVEMFQSNFIWNKFPYVLISSIFQNSFSCHFICWDQWVNTLRPRQNGHHFTDDTFQCICLNENVRIFIKTSLKFVPKCRINNIPALVQIMAWHHPGDKPLSEPSMARLPVHICVTRPQWVKMQTLCFIPK